MHNKDNIKELLKADGFIITLQWIHILGTHLYKVFRWSQIIDEKIKEIICNLLMYDTIQVQREKCVSILCQKSIFSNKEYFISFV